MPPLSVVVPPLKLAVLLTFSMPAFIANVPPATFRLAVFRVAPLALMLIVPVPPRLVVPVTFRMFVPAWLKLRTPVPLTVRLATVVFAML